MIVCTGGSERQCGDAWDFARPIRDYPVVEEANFDWSGRVEDAHWIGHTHFPRGKLAGVVIINFSHAY